LLARLGSFNNNWLYTSGFSARYLMVLARESTSSSSLIYKIEPGEGAKSWIFGGPTTTGLAPTTRDWFAEVL